MYYINDLVIEVTRRCNVACAHCLRGDAQSVDISCESISNLLKSVSGIGTISFTGGEPSLAVERIRYIFNAIKESQISLGNFYVVTNGLVPSMDLVHVLIDMYAYCDNIEEDIGGLSVSGDQYHQAEIGTADEARKLYRALRFFRETDRQGELKSLIREGRATELHDAVRDVIPAEYSFEIWDDRVSVDGIVYLNALGDIVPGCDFSYESQEEHKLGNVNQKSLETILKGPIMERGYQ